MTITQLLQLLVKLNLIKQWTKIDDAHYVIEIL